MCSLNLCDFKLSSNRPNIRPASSRHSVFSLGVQGCKNIRSGGDTVKDIDSGPYLTSLSELLVPQRAHRSTPEATATVSPMSWATACAVSIWLLQLASEVGTLKPQISNTKQNNKVENIKVQTFQSLHQQIEFKLARSN